MATITIPQLVIKRDKVCKCWLAYVVTANRLYEASVQHMYVGSARTRHAATEAGMDWIARHVALDAYWQGHEDGRKGVLDFDAPHYNN